LLESVGFLANVWHKDDEKRFLVVAGVLEGQNEALIDLIV